MTKIIFFLMGLTLSQALMAAPSNYFMFVGEVKVYQIDEPVERVAVGNGKLLSTSITDKGELILIAESKGDTNIHIWMKNGNEHRLKVYVTEKDIARVVSELKQALSGVKKLKIKKVGDFIVLEGEVEKKYQTVIEEVGKKYDSLINLVEYNDFLGDNFSELQSALKAVPGLSIRKLGDRILLEGDVDEKYKLIMAAVLEAFGGSNILNLTKTPTVLNNKMIYMNVKITEFATSDLDELGIDWDSQVNGPYGGYIGGNKIPRGLSGGDGSRTISDLADAGYTGGYFGIATEITSRINLLVSSGDALLLAEPRLSAYSGGEAEFLAGGELPIPFTNSDGSISVEYKEYGIILKINPIADEQGNISAHVETEVSSVDESVSVEGVPGFKTRRTYTDVRMKDKQTLVLSGLINNEISKDKSGLPVLGEAFEGIPVLGRLFQSEGFNSSQTQLVIFVTPTIYDADSELNKQEEARAKSLVDSFKSKTGIEEIID
ncbi:MAG: pilus assembly protein N-terminal domain-containing protein [Gammaproteobacteria bacterium]|nr:pilus assembly protein N-terminal domain-containing protein [Gammaproteobacteria bacterium]